MKIIRDRLREILVLIPIVSFAIFSGYYLYNSYQSYNKAQTSLTYIKYQEYLEALMSELGNEEWLVSVYLGKRGDSSLQKIKEQWRETNKAISDLEDFLSQSGISSNISIINSLKVMKSKRSKISNLNTSFIELYLKDPRSQAKNIIIDKIKSIDNSSFDNSNNLILLDEYISITSLKETSYSEAS